MRRLSPLRSGGLLAFLLFSLLTPAHATAVGPFVQQGAKLSPIQSSGDGEFGVRTSLSNDGNTAVFSAHPENRAFVFSRSGTTWSQMAPPLTGTGAVGNASQGDAVAISGDGNTIAVGGSLDNSGAGAVWIYTRSGNDWIQQGSKLVASDATTDARFGTSVALSDDGSTLAVGGFNDAASVGATWIFTRSGATWSQQGGKLTASDAIGAARQGTSVSLSADGNTLLTGGPGHDTNKGASWIFARFGGTWSQIGLQLAGSDATAGAVQGVSVALARDGRTAIAGGPGDAGGIGAAWIFTWNGSAWVVQGAKLVPSDVSGANASVGFACAISADGNVAAVGAWRDSGPTGAAWVFTRSGSLWTRLQPKLVGTGAFGAAFQGSAVALSSDGNTLISTGPNDTVARGAAWVFVNPLVENCQFASSVLNFSSEFSPTDWSAAQALGAPNVYPTYCDCTWAWAPANQDDQPEFLHFGFATAQRINFVNVYETYAPGAVSSIAVRNPASGVFETVWTETASPAPPASRLYTATFPVTPYEVSEIAITIDSPAVGDYNEIDAVGIGYRDRVQASQWASDVHAVSSQFSPTAWSSAQALGAPDVYPMYGDIDRAWASFSPDDQPEVIELDYSNPGPINFVNVYETYSPGALNHVSVVNPNTNLYETVWTGVAEPQPSIARIRTVSFPETRFPVSRVRLGFDSPAVPDWNEVDAVGIGRCACTASWVGVPTGPVEPRSGTIEWARPNPFVASTAIAFTLARAGRVQVEVFDVLGQRVTQVMDRVLPAGPNQAAWDGRRADGRAAASGIYYVRVKSDELNGARKVVKIE